MFCLVFQREVGDIAQNIYYAVLCEFFQLKYLHSVS